VRGDEGEKRGLKNELRVGGRVTEKGDEYEGEKRLEGGGEVYEENRRWKGCGKCMMCTGKTWW